MKILLEADAIMPTRAHDDDAGLDLFSPIDVYIYPHSRETIDTGVHLEIPKGYVGLLTSKSGLMRNYGITTRGTIDCGYTGSISAIVFNDSPNTHHFRRGDKLTQLVIVPCITPELELADKLEDTERGDSGFGSTGR